MTNLGDALQAGDVFQLFSQPVSGFAAVNLPAVGPGLGWVNQLANNGTLVVVSTASPNLTTQLSGGNQLTLTWPTDHTGWRLQVQTNSLDTGLGTNWWDFIGAVITNQMTFSISPVEGGIFYRLTYP